MEAMQLMALLEERFSVSVWSLGVWCVTLPLDAKAVMHSNVAPIQHSCMKLTAVLSPASGHRRLRVYFVNARNNVHPCLLVSRCVVVQLSLLSRPSVSTQRSIFVCERLNRNAPRCKTPSSLCFLDADKRATCFISCLRRLMVLPTLRVPSFWWRNNFVHGVRSVAGVAWPGETPGRGHARGGHHAFDPRAHNQGWRRHSRKVAAVK